MSEFTTKNPTTQMHQLPAGLLPGDYDTELFGVRETRKVYGICNGSTIPFKNISKALHANLFSMMLKDEKAMHDLKDYDQEKALEEFAFCLYGAADHEADFSPEGKPGKSENFMCGDNCRCMAWNSKRITINGNELTPRQIEISKYLASDMPDKQIAATLNITESTLDGHKHAIYLKAGVQSKAGYVKRAIKENLIQ